MHTLLKHSLLLTGSADDRALETALKHSLLIIHGTVYGTSPSMPGWKGFDLFPSAHLAKEKSVCRPVFAFPADIIPVPSCGPLTDNTPIDMLPWSVTGGGQPVNILAPWQQCLTLYTRSII